MNDHRFIELVNLYVDREITAAETAELEIEIQTNPARRAIYNQYCKINRATALVYDSFRAQASEPAAAVTGQGTIEHFESAQRDRRPAAWRYYAGGLAAAACVAFALVRFGGAESSTSPANLAAQSTAPAPASVVASNEPVAVRQSSPASGDSVTLRKSAESDQNYLALLTALRQEDQRSVADAQLKSMRVQSLFEDGVFDGKQLSGGMNQRIFRSQQSAQPQAEFTAFQFQR